MTPPEAADICRRIGKGMLRGKGMDKLKAGNWLIQVAEWIETERSGGEMIVCDFCGKNQNEVKELIASGHDSKQTAHICNECILLCVEILANKPKQEGAKPE